MDTTGTLLAKSAHLQEIALVLDLHIKSRRGESQNKTGIDGLSILDSRHFVHPLRTIVGPAILMTVQGAYCAMMGETRYTYQAGQAAIISTEVPCDGPTPDPGSTGPYLGLVLELDRGCTKDVIEKLSERSKSSTNIKGNGNVVLDLSCHLLNCVLRIVRLLDTPEAIPMLYPGIMREICYWLLNGPARDQIVSTMAKVHDGRVLQTIQHLRGNFTEPIRVDELASAAGMSAATFHRQFKSVTSTSPLQYQKKLRLLEARRLMTTSDFNVETAAFEVGYVSPSQFSREYARMFGRPPRRDVSSCRSNPTLMSNSA